MHISLPSFAYIKCAFRGFIRAVYKPPQVPDVDAMIPVIDTHLSDYRRVYIEHPRVRLDGVYIAICHYV